MRFVANWEVRRLWQTNRLGEEFPLGSRGGIAARHYCPLDGEYVIQVRLQRNRGGTIIGIGRKKQVDVRLDGARLKLFEVGGNSKSGADTLRYQMAGGSGGVLPKGSALAREEYLAVGEVDGVGLLDEQAGAEDEEQPHEEAAQGDDHDHRGRDLGGPAEQGAEGHVAHDRSRPERAGQTFPDAELAKVREQLLQDPSKAADYIRDYNDFKTFLAQGK